MKHGIAAVLAASLALAACVSGFKSNEVESQIYVLHKPAAVGAATVPRSPSTAPTDPLTVVVLTPEVAAGLDTARIALLQPGQRLNYYVGARWAEALPAVLQSAVVEALRAAGRFASVEPEGGPFLGNTLLRVEVHDFEVDYTGGAPVAHVALRATLGHRADRAVLATTDADSHVPASVDRMQAVIDALQRALDEALGQLTAALPPAASAR